MSIRRMNESFDKKFKEEYAPVEEIKEGYELLDGTKVELYRDYDKAVARAKELGLKEAEYGDAYGVSYCMWNTSGDRNEDEEVIAYYKFEGRKPRPLTDDEAERIARDIGVQFEDFDESLKEDYREYYAYTPIGVSTSIGGDNTYDYVEDAILEAKMFGYKYIREVRQRHIADFHPSEDSYTVEEAERVFNTYVDVKKFGKGDVGKEAMDAFLKDHSDYEGLVDSENWGFPVYFAYAVSKTPFNESLKEDVFANWKPNTNFRHIQQVLTKAKERGRYANNEREEVFAALDLCDKGKYTPEQRKFIRDAHAEMWRKNRGEVKESLSPSERREFISKMTKALMGDKFGYSRAEANDIAIKRADALGSDWRVRWGGDIDKEIKQELENTMSKVGYRAIHGIMADESVEDNFATTYEAGGTVKRYVDDIVNGVFELDTPNPQTNRFLECLEALDRMGVVMPCEWEDVTKDILRDELKKVSLKRLLDIDYKLEKIFKRPFIMGESLKEGKRGFVRKYKGCSIHDAGDVFVCTNEHGLNIGQSRTESGCEGLIDEYIKNKGAKNESKLSERNLTKADESLKEKEEVSEKFHEVIDYIKGDPKLIRCVDMSPYAERSPFEIWSDDMSLTVNLNRYLRGDNHYATFGEPEFRKMLADLRNHFSKYPMRFYISKQYGELVVRWDKYTAPKKEYDAEYGKMTDESLKESQSQEIAYYYRQLKDKNGFDVARLADAFYKTPEWKEIDFQGDVLFTEKGWNAFKKWAKETKNVDIKDLGSSDDFLGEGRLTEKKWRYTLKNGRALRDAIETEDCTAILATIQLCYQELNDAGIIDDDDCDRWVQDIDDIDIEDATYDDIDWELDQFYDLCDNIGVWIPLNEDTVKQGSQWVNKGKEGTHGKFKTKKEADAQRKAMYANGFGESKKLKESRGGRFQLSIWVPGSGGDDDRERDLFASDDINEIIRTAYNTELDNDEAFYLSDYRGIYEPDLDQCYSAEDLEDQIHSIWRYSDVNDLSRRLGRALLPKRESKGKRLPSKKGINEDLGLSKGDKDALIKAIDDAKKRKDGDYPLDVDLSNGTYVTFGTRGMSLHKIAGRKEKEKYVPSWREKSGDDIIKELSSQDWKMDESCNEDVVCGVNESTEYRTWKKQK